MKALILMSFDLKKEIVIEMDTLDYALGAILNQKGELRK